MSGGALRELLAIFNVEVDTGKLEHAHEKLEAAKVSAENLGEGFEKLKTIAEAALGVFAVEKIVETTEELAKDAVELQNSADAAGISVDALETWRGVAEATGQDANSLGYLFKTLSLKVYEASQG